MPNAVYNLARWDKLQRQWGATGGPSWNTTIAGVQSGHETRKQRWVDTLGQWELGNRGVLEEEYQELLDFFLAMRGRTYGFRIRDWTDFRDNGRGILGSTGLASPDVAVYQLCKRRTVAATGASYAQPITRPVGHSFADDPDLGDTVKLFVNGVEQVQDNSGAPAAGTWSVDDETGLATYHRFSAGFDSLVKVSPGLVQVVLDTAMALEVGDWLAFSGIPAPADAFNGAWQVQTVDGPTMVTVASPYAGDDYAGDVGTVYLGLPQDAALTWTGEYDKPARFDTDGPLPAQIVLMNESSPDGSTAPTGVGIQLGTVPVVQLRETS